MVFIANNLDLRVVSSATPKAAGVMEWTRQVTGTQLYGGEIVTMDIAHSGREESIVDYGFAIYEYQFPLLKI